MQQHIFTFMSIFGMRNFVKISFIYKDVVSLFGSNFGVTTNESFAI